MQYLPEYANWGVKIAKNHSYNNAYGALETHYAHIGIGMFQTDKNSTTDFDFTFPYMIDGLVFVVPKRLIPKQKLMLNIDIWITLTIAYILISLLFYYSEIKQYKRNSLQKTFLTTYCILLNSSIPKMPRKIFNRIIFLIWCTSTWILMIDIQSYLMYYLTHETYSKEINTIKELSRSNLKIGMYVHLRDNFRDGQLKYEKLLYEKYVDCNVDDKCLNQTSTIGDIAIIRPLKTINYEIANKYLNANGLPKLEIIKETIVMRYVNICFPKGFPLYQTINRLLARIKSQGFINYWENWYLNYINILRNKQIEKSITFTSKALNFRHFDGVFKLLIYGLTLAFTTFLFEIVKFKYIDKRNVLVRFKRRFRQIYNSILTEAL